MMRFVAFLLAIGCASANKFFIMAPSMLHVGVEEKVSVKVHPQANQDVNVKMYLQDYPARRNTFSEANGVFQKDVFGSLTVKEILQFFGQEVDAANLPDVKSLDKQYVYLVVKSDDAHCQFQKEAKILLSYRNGLILIQTDKPVYTPKQQVRIRVFPLGFDLKPTSNKVTLIVENPQGIRVQQWNDLDADKWIISKRIQLNDFVLNGNWTIKALYGHQNVYNTSAKFEVKEYVLPKFSVKLKVPTYILETDKNINIVVTSRFSYDKPVVGSLRVNLKIAGENMDPILFSRNELLLDDGEATVTDRTNAIEILPGNIWFPEGGRLLVEATVTEKGTGVKQTVTDKSAEFTSTPYKIKFKDTAKYFKPGLPFVVKVEVKYPNDKPAVGLALAIEAKGTKRDGTEESLRRRNATGKDQTGSSGQAEFIVDTSGDVVELDIKVETKNSDLTAEQNGENHYSAKAYSSPSNSFLMLKQFEPGKIVAKGRIVEEKSIQKNPGILTTISIVATADMSPSARLVGYYVLDSGEIVSDSILLDIADEFPTPVVFSEQRANENADVIKRPSVDYIVSVETPAGTRVGLLGVDQSVYLINNNNRMTSDRVFKEIEELDLGCGGGGGKDWNGVFLNAGVTVMTEHHVSDTRQSYGCPPKGPGSRKKRSLVQSLVSCCEKGKKPNPRNCARRVQTMGIDDGACKTEFIRCCSETFGDRGMSILARSGFDGGFQMSDEEIIEQLQTRSFFPETWIYDDITADGSGIARLPVTIPDTITTWVLQAVAINSNTGFGLSKPLNLLASLDLFVSLKIPYSVQRGEQVSIMATVFNYAGMKVTVRLYLVGSRRFCSLVDASAKVPIATLKDMQANEVRSVSFPIVPKDVGKIPIDVIAVAVNMNGGDRIRKKLLVVPEGVERRQTQSFVLDPQSILGNNEQTNTIQLDVPTNAVPGSVSGMVYINGDLMGPVVTNLINDNMESLLRYPTGSGESTVSRMSYSVYVLQYLQSTKQATDAMKRRTYDYIQKGYARELSIARRDDKSFAIYQHLPGSTWLTAFVMKVFCQARKLGGPFIDPNVVCQAAEWIIGNQREDGVFVENYASHIGRHAGNEDEVSLTAFVLISLLECRCSDVDTQGSINKAVNYLEGQIEGLKELYSLSLATYALSMTSSPKKMRANERLTQQAIFDPTANKRHWDSGWDALDVETAGYALLAQMALGKMTYAGSIVVWLTEQRNTKGAFRSTHDTSIALQALSKYSEITAGNELDLTISMTVDNIQNWNKTCQITRKNKLLQIQTDVTQFLGGNLTVNTTGKGVTQMQVEVRYNVPSTQEESCEFKVDVNVKPVTEEKTNGGDNRDSTSKKGKATMGICYERYKQGKGCSRKKGPKMTYSDCCGRKNRLGWSVDLKGRKRCKKCTKAPKKKNKKPVQPAQKSIVVNVCTRYKRNGSITGMSMVEVGIFTGYAVDLLSLEEIKKNVTEVDIIETSDRTVVFYLSKIPSDRDICLTFKVHRENDVGPVQPVPVNVYDYYEPSEWCTTFYGPDKRSSLSMDLCTKKEYKCSPADPSIKNKKKIQAKACKEYDFAFKGEVIFIDKRKSWLTFDVRVGSVFKQGKSAVKKGDFVEFKKKATCLGPDLKKRTQYVFMGRDKNRQRVLDNSAWVKLWPESGKNNTDLQEIFGKLSCST